MLMSKQLRTNFIGGSVSSQIKKNAIMGILLAVIGIALYIAWAFRKVSAPVTSWEYGLGAIIALGHDILVTLGVFAVLGSSTVLKWECRLLQLC
jgi:preprotein translocase subunit SecF